MSYCPKCGNKVEETMAFCPHCGAALKVTAATSQPVPAPSRPYRRQEKAEKNEKQEKNQPQEKGEKQEKSERGFVGFLIGGLILITIGIFSLLELNGSYFSSGQNLAVMLFIIGIIIIIGAVYVAMTARKHFPAPS